MNRKILINQAIRSIKNWSTSQEAPAHVTVFFAMLLMASIPTSPFLLSIGMWGLVFVAFWNLAKSPDAPSGISRSTPKYWWVILKRSFIKLFRQHEYSVFLLLLAVPVLSGLWSEDTEYWIVRSRVRLPFLVLPWAFVNLPRLTGRQLRLALYVLVWFMVLLCLGIGIHYYLHQSEILDAIQHGGQMPVPRNHIRFSLLLATTVVVGGKLWLEQFVWRYRWERHALAIAVIFLFGFIHFLSVRSGLVALYAVLLFSLGLFTWRTGRWKTALLLMGLVVIAPLVALNTMPSLKQKLNYTFFDWEQYSKGEGVVYSDAARWISLKTGWKIWLENPVAGVGAGDIKEETARTVQQHFPEYAISPKLPHNQFLYILAGTGLLGFLLSMLAFLYPVFIRKYRMDYLFIAFQLMAFSSFLVEYTIETSIGVAWYLFFTLWFMKMATD